MASNTSLIEVGSTDSNVEIWKIKRLIKSLESVRGNGTSMISLMIPPKDPICRAAKLLAEELGTASNIKSRVNQKSVISAILSVQQRLKLYSRVPLNGLVIYCGTITTEDGKEKMVNIDFEPFKPIRAPMYLCDSRFHTEVLSDMLKDDARFGFIIMDGNGALFGILAGNSREVVHKFSVELPKKHGRGGQSALRFARLRLEKRHNYIRKVAEVAQGVFINTTQNGGGGVNIEGIILAGSADFKTELSSSELLDKRLQAKIMKIVDISYGGEAGFNQAIQLSTEMLVNVNFIKEKELVGRYFDEIYRDTGKYCFGVCDTLQALEMGAIGDLIVWEGLNITRYVMRGDNDDTIIRNLTPEQEDDPVHFHDKDNGRKLDILETMSLLDWIVDNYQSFGAVLHFVSDKSQEGSQFVKGFGGIGGILRYKVDFISLVEVNEDEEEEFDYYNY